MSTRSLPDPFSALLRQRTYAANSHLAAICLLSHSYRSVIAPKWTGPPYSYNGSSNARKM